MSNFLGSICKLFPTKRAKENAGESTPPHPSTSTPEPTPQTVSERSVKSATRPTKALVQLLESLEVGPLGLSPGEVEEQALGLADAFLSRVQDQGVTDPLTARSLANDIGEVMVASAQLGRAQALAQIAQGTQDILLAPWEEVMLALVNLKSLLDLRVQLEGSARMHLLAILSGLVGMREDNQDAVLEIVRMKILEVVTLLEEPHV